MEVSEKAVLEVSVEGPQLEFLENKAKELGLSKEELLRWYIVSDMVGTKKRTGLFDGLNIVNPEKTA